MTNHITLDTPNIPILTPDKSALTPYGEFVNSRDYFAHLDPQDGVIRSRDMYLPNVSIREFEGTFSRDIVFENRQGEHAELPGSCLLLKAKVHSYLAAGGHAMTSFWKSQNFKFDPNNEYLHKAEANSELHFFHVSYEPEYLARLLPEDQRWSEELRERIFKRRRVFGKKYNPLSQTQLRAIQNIADCPFGGQLGVMIAEASVTQVILMQLSQLFEEASEKPGSTGKCNVELAYGLQEYLSHTFLQDHSIDELSRQFGVNANKLMANFKQQFGKSIFEYITELRMEHAVHLLQEKHARVADVARTLGYKNPNHFSSAFKRVVGTVPTALRQRTGSRQ